MKFKTLSAVALLAVVGVATTAPALASASSTLPTPSATVQNSNGKLEVDKGSVNPDGGVVNPEKPEGPKVPTSPDGPVIPNPNVLDKGIAAVSALDFGKITVGTPTAAAKGVPGTVDGVDTTLGNLVSFGDLSGTYTGYTITAAMSQQFTHGTDSSKLKGATITYTNPLLKTDGSGTISTAPLASGVLAAAAADGVSAGPSVTFVSAKAKEGAGNWTLEFGQSAEYKVNGAAVASTGTAETSVNLAIPQAVANSMTAGTYTAVVTWTMGATPTA